MRAARMGFFAESSCAVPSNQASTKVEVEGHFIDVIEREIEREDLIHRAPLHVRRLGIGLAPLLERLDDEVDRDVLPIIVRRSGRELMRKSVSNRPFQPASSRSSRRTPSTSVPSRSRNPPGRPHFPPSDICDAASRARGCRFFRRRLFDSVRLDARGLTLTRRGGGSNWCCTVAVVHTTDGVRKPVRERGHDVSRRGPPRCERRRGLTSM